MKKILLISDTHGYIDDVILKYAKKADLVIHAGDIGDINVIDSLSKVSNLRAVYGIKKIPVNAIRNGNFEPIFDHISAIFFLEQKICTDNFEMIFGIFDFFQKTNKNKSSY